MATAIKIPKLGLSDETTLIGGWHKKKGDRVKAGEVVLTIQTDKASFDIEAEADGTFLAALVEEGDEVPVLINAGVIGEVGEDISEFLLADSPPAAPFPVEARVEPIPISSRAVPVDDASKLKVSPRARRTAEKLNVDIRWAEPTGAEGRIIERDILALQEKGTFVTSSVKGAGLLDQAGHRVGSGIGGRVTTYDLVEKPTVEYRQETDAAGVIAPDEGIEDYERVKLEGVRKVISQTMMNSLHSTAQLTLTSSFDASEILQYRERIKTSREKLGLENITLNDIILFAVSRTLRTHRRLNAHLTEDQLLLFNRVHLGLAVDTDRGLLVPTIFNADQLSLNELANTSKALIQKTKEGTLLPQEMRDGTFTITNLGHLGIESFTPILNPPQVGILGVNAIVERFKKVEGKEVLYPAMGLSLTFDHRALDGAPAARFLHDLKHHLEHFDLLLAK